MDNIKNKTLKEILSRADDDLPIMIKGTDGNVMPLKSLIVYDDAGKFQIELSVTEHKLERTKQVDGQWQPYDTNRFSPRMSRDEARGCFPWFGLSYADITAENLVILQALLQSEIELSSAVTKIHFKEELRSILFVDQKFIYAEFLVTGEDTEDRRECITFNEDGFIEFAEWADEICLAPIMAAFFLWCDEVQNEKRAKAIRAKRAEFYPDRV